MKYLTLLMLLFILIAPMVTADAAEIHLPNWHLADKNHTVLKGKFQQTKRTKHLRRPLQSNGTIVLSPQAGIAWQTIFPVKSTLVISKTAIITIDSQGKRKQVGGGGELNLVFLNALVGNWVKLKDHFALTVNQTTTDKEQQICVDLQPQTDLLKQNIKLISVCGSHHKFHHMTITEHNDSSTKTTMDLTPYAALTSQEQALFVND